jgi:hypothetical protein
MSKITEDIEPLNCDAILTIKTNVTKDETFKSWKSQPKSAAHFVEKHSQRLSTYQEAVSNISKTAKSAVAPLK